MATLLPETSKGEVEALSHRGTCGKGLRLPLLVLWVAFLACTSVTTSGQPLHSEVLGPVRVFKTWDPYVPREQAREEGSCHQYCPAERAVWTAPLVHPRETLVLLGWEARDITLELCQHHKHGGLLALPCSRFSHQPLVLATLKPAACSTKVQKWKTGWVSEGVVNIPLGVSTSLY